jgi:hypothetical protein
VRGLFEHKVTPEAKDIRGGSGHGLKMEDTALGLTETPAGLGHAEIEIYGVGAGFFSVDVETSLDHRAFGKAEAPQFSESFTEVSAPIEALLPSASPAAGAFVPFREVDDRSGGIESQAGAFSAKNRDKKLVRTRQLNLCFHILDDQSVSDVRGERQKEASFFEYEPFQIELKILERGAFEVELGATRGELRGQRIIDGLERDVICDDLEEAAQAQAFEFEVNVVAAKFGQNPLSDETGETDVVQPKQGSAKQAND